MKRFPSWTADPVPGYDETEEPLAFKYYGSCDASSTVRGEFQIVSMLTALFWEVEHSAIYKPAPQLRVVARHHGMQQRTRGVHEALRAFEEEFESRIVDAPEP